PPASPGLTASKALAFPSVQLFVEHAAATLDGFEVDDAEAPIVADICRKLEGMPLAIELAATRVDAFGVRQLSTLLDDRMRLLKYGKRTAQQRHQTLSAALDWSYEFLPEDERALLRRLSVFSGAFTLDSARAVAAVANVDLAEGIANLVAKSLIAADIRGEIVRYRLLDTTRAYALQKLTDAGEFAEAAKRHAEHVKAVFEQANVAWDSLSTVDWLARYAPYIDDVRAALDWAHSPAGDPITGTALAATAIPLWLEMWLLDECRVRAEQALRIVERDGSKGDDQRMRLYAAVALSQAYAAPSVRDTRATWVAALQIAQALNDTEYQLRALWGVWCTHVNRGEFKESLVVATQFSQLAAAKSDSNDQLVGDRMTGAALHFLGDQQRARTHIERMLAFYAPPTSRSNMIRFQFDQRVTAQTYLARILWLQGEADRAARISKSNIEDARAAKQPQSLCSALAGAAVPIAFSTGDIETAERCITVLLDLTAREALEIWHAHAVCYEGQLLLRRGEVGRGLGKLRAGIDRLTNAEFNQYIVALLGLLAQGLAIIDDISRALAVIDDALARSERDEAKWYYPELLRIKGSVLLRRDALADSELAQEQFLSSLKVARQQSALAWELRTSISLARLWRTQGQAGEAHAILRSVCDRFTEGHNTPDLRNAASLLSELASG
ncbi:MAG: hypothetical protein JO255_12490, partial [Alphaproteobacteria bacterium]|nr:hypothetical protein [Alphaproteobacteria bacterium]